MKAAIKFTSTIFFLLTISSYGLAQITPLLDIDGVSKFKGILFQSNNEDVTSVDIRNNFDLNMTFPIDSYNYYMALYKNNTIIGQSSAAQSLLRNSSILGFNAGSESIGEDNIAIGYATAAQSSGDKNIAIGNYAGVTTDGDNNIIIGNMNSPILMMGPPLNKNYHKNIIIGNTAGQDLLTGSENIIIGHNAGPSSQLNSQLFIGNSGDSSEPLIGGSFTSQYVDINGTLNIEESLNITDDIIINGNITSASGEVHIDKDLVLKNDAPFSRSLRLIEVNQSGEFGFKLNYNGQSDQLELSTIGFSGNEGIRNIWTKSGKMGIGDITPLSTLHISKGTDANIANGGYLTIGSTSQNIVIDNNEIMARTQTDQPNKLYLNIGGETVVVGKRLKLAHDTTDLTIDERGEIRYNRTTNDFEGYDGTTWYSLTTNKSSFASSATSNSTSTKSKISNIGRTTITEKSQLESRITKLEQQIAHLTALLEQK